MRILNEQQRTLRTLRQSGHRVSKIRDAARLSMLPGKRVSRTGKEYWETRKNRSDALGSNL